MRRLEFGRQRFWNQPLRPPLVMNSEWDATQGQKIRSVFQTTFTQTGRQTSALVVPPFIVQYNGKSQSHSIDQAINTFTGTDRYGIVSPKSFQSFLTWYYGGSDVISHIKEPARTFSTVDRGGLEVMGATPNLEDCYYRMLVAQEVKVGMAFRGDYIVKGSSRQQVKQLGNAVTPPAMELLMERCVETLM